MLNVMFCDDEAIESRRSLTCEDHSQGSHMKALEPLKHWLFVPLIS